MDQSNSYRTEKIKLYTQKIRALQQQLPIFCGSFFRAIDSYTSVLTRYAYAVDLQGFFHYLVNASEIIELHGRDVPSLTIPDLKLVRAYDIEMYLDWTSLYLKDEREIVNCDRAKARKLSSIRSMYKYFFKQEMLENNVAALVDIPKLHEKPIIRLEPNEVALLLDHVENGDGLSERQKQYHATTAVRDLAILTLFLGTGIRISELVGIDKDDIDFENDSFVITRKGGSQDILSFGEEVRTALLAYQDQRQSIMSAEGSENAFFLSLQKHRITIRAVENLVKKYARIAAPLKKISPHKLRSTYGTMLYHETQDIYLVADVLGHKDVNTTRRHYAAASEDNKRIAAQKIKLRDD